MGCAGADSGRYGIASGLPRDSETICHESPLAGDHRSAVKQSAAMPGVQRGGFALFGFLNLHSESLCGRLYPLPLSTTFHFRNVLHLVEARNRVAYVRSIFQRLLALFGERELGCRYPITSWFGQLCHCFPSSGAPPAPEPPRNSWPPRLRQLFQLLQRGVVDVIFFSRGFGHAQL